MSVVNDPSDRISETVSWSDPFVGLQYERFCRARDDFDQKLDHVSIEQRDSLTLDVARDLCEWSRQLLNRAFGRTTRDEYFQIMRLYLETAKLVELWAKDVTDHETRSRVHVYAKHIESRAS